MGNFKKWFITPKIKPYQYIMSLIGIFLVIFMDTEMYDSWPDFVKLIFYGGIIMICTLAGISILDIKEIARKFKEVMENKSMSLWERIQAYTRIGLESFSKAGEDWDLYTNIQFEEYKAMLAQQKDDRVADLTTELEILKEQLKSNGP